MDLASWLGAHRPGRGGASWLHRISGCAPETIARALRGEPLIVKAAAQRISDATDGQVTVEELMEGGVRAKPKKKATRKLARKKLRRKSGANRKTSAVRSAA